MAIYQPPKPWQGRNDGSDDDVQRWHQAVTLIHLEDIENLPVIKTIYKKVSFIDFCSDEGVSRNQGRVGAKDGADAIRNACSSFPVHFEKLQLFDAGAVHCDDGNLEAAQILLGEKIQQLIVLNYFPIVLGGGHEVAYGNFKGIQPQIPKNGSFGMINFDAHFDLRKVEPNIGSTSGTGIWQMAEDCKNNKTEFQYLAIGIQDCSNTKRLFETARNIGALYIKSEEFTNDQLEHILDYISHVLDESQMVQVSIDMDVFTAANAPGVSAPAFNGIPPNAMFKRLLRHIVFSGKVAAIDFAEVNPLYDVDSRTSRLAASLIFDIVQALEQG